MHSFRLTVFLAACMSQTSVASSQVCADFELGNAKIVFLRARNAEQAEISTGANVSKFRVCGVPSGGTEGYHPADPNWRETPPNEWGLAFKAKRYGDTLVVSSSNEIEYIHHLYYLDKLKVTAPKGITVKLKNRTLNGEGKADLSEPKAF